MYDYYDIMEFTKVEFDNEIQYELEWWGFYVVW
jgi:hypothetical protein